MIDVTDAGLLRAIQRCSLGQQGTEEITADELRQNAHDQYEVCTKINPKIARIYV